MHASRAKVDLLILGAGPAGCAAAIHARRFGRSVVLIEKYPGPRAAPGETLHPGVQPILEQLGIWQAVLDACFLRHRGIWVEEQGQRQFLAYGETNGTPWLGIQAPRKKLHAILQTAAVESGARLIRRRGPLALVDMRLPSSGLRVGNTLYRGRWLLDGTGTQAWLAIALGLSASNYSPQLSARFGWRAKTSAAKNVEPILKNHSSGWDWCAPLGDGTEAWVELRSTTDFERANSRRALGADVSWRLYPKCSGQGYFLLGDAAARLDPASSNGVLRALMSGIMASHLARHVIMDTISEAQAAKEYRDWIASRFHSDVEILVTPVAHRNQSHEILSNSLV
jgi:flavin-dependent dehydrogenase